MEHLTNNQKKFLELVIKARHLHFDVNKIIKNNPVKQEEKRKMLMLARKNIHDNDSIEVLLILIKRNILLKTALFFLIRYYIKAITNSLENIIDDDDLF
jgi:hypothetical protein